MNYELAKLLKDAGFPQIKRSERKHGGVWRIENDETIMVPTLQELIDACGEDFWCLIKSQLKPGIWKAQSYRLGGEVEMVASAGDEAVAGLWLILNDGKGISERHLNNPGNI
jgi:hypothetical protein